MQTHQYRITFKSVYHDCYLHCDEIMYIQGGSGSVTLWFAPGSKHGTKDVVSTSLTELMQQLPPNFFMRVHNSWIVNMEHVTGHTKKAGHQLKMTNGELIPIARLRKKEVLRALETYYSTNR